MNKKKNKLLIVIDMQNDFIGGVLGSEEARAIVDNVVEKINKWKGGIIATQDTHDYRYSETREGRYLPVKHCIEGTHGWQINSKVKEALDAKGVIPIQKRYFGSTFITEMLKKIHYDSVELIGLCTDICVISNALLIKNIHPELDIVVDSKCCAGATPETHEAALKVMKMCQIDII